MYADESGDTGINNSPTKYFTISSLIVHESKWLESLNQLVAFRRRMKKTFGLKMTEEIHAAAMISNPGRLARIKRYDRLTIVRMFADEIASLPAASSINVVVVKKPSDTSDAIFDRGWRALIQRFENTLGRCNFPGSVNARDAGVLFCDATDIRLDRLLRKMRRYNPIPNIASYGGGFRNLPVVSVVEDPIHRDSAATYFVQAADTIAYLLYQRGVPNAYMFKRGGRNYFTRLDPILCKSANQRHKYGIVIL